MYDVIITGAGAAGLMAAGVAARDGKKVAVVEKMEKAARKVRITGKGRCNLTNIKPHEEFLEKIKTNREFFRPAFEAFDNNAVLRFFREEGVRLTVERGGRVFPESGKAWDIADALVDWAVQNGAEIMYNTRVHDLMIIGGKVRGVRVTTKKGYERNLEARNVIIATGGVSYPATGSTGDGYDLAHDAGHRIEEVRPALVPLESDSELARGLTSLKLRNVNVRLMINGNPVREEFGEMEFTGRGLEGAVILKLSRDAVDALIDRQTVEVSIDLKTALDREVIGARIEREISGLEEDSNIGDLLRKLMPKPMIAPFAEAIELVPNKPLSALNQDGIFRIIRQLKDLRLPITDYRPFEEAVVTAGGVDAGQVDPRTMQSQLVEGLYFAGEVLDIDADTGGYNLQVAFSTGHLAGKLLK